MPDARTSLISRNRQWCWSPFRCDLEDTRNPRRDFAAEPRPSRVIAQAVGNINANDWTIALRDRAWMRIPLSLSQLLAPDLTLRYFNPDCVRFVLAALIERRILDNKANDAQVRKTFRDDYAAVVAGLSKIKLT
jgi:hypothetical protein